MKSGNDSADFKVSSCQGRSRDWKMSLRFFCFVYHEFFDVNVVLRRSVDESTEEFKFEFLIYLIAWIMSWKSW